MDILRRNPFPIFICLIAAAVGIYAAEAYVLLFVRGDFDRIEAGKIAAAELEESCRRNAARFGYMPDRRTRLQALNDLRQSGKEAYPGQFPTNLLSIAPQLVRHTLPLGGIGGTWTQLCNEACNNVSYRNDERGFRNPHGLWNRSEIQIATVGDSFTQGICMPDGSGIAGLLRRHIPATVNVGVGGTGPVVQLAILREYLGSVKPRVVLWFYYEGNDLTAIAKEQAFQKLARYLDPSYPGQDLAKRQAATDAVWREFMTVAVEPLLGLNTTRAPDRAATVRPFSDKGHFADILRLRNMRHVLNLRAGSASRKGDDTVSLTSSEVARDMLPRFEHILMLARATVAQWNGQLFLVYLPEYWRYRFNPANRMSGSGLRKEVLALSLRIGGPVIDASAAFDRYSDAADRFWVSPYGHYNHDGYALVAEMVRARLEADGALSPIR